MESNDSILKYGCPGYCKNISIICEICEKEEKLKNVIPHLATHTGVSNCLICIKCEQRFPSQGMFYKHMTMFHAVRINCRFCSESFYSKHVLFKHVRKVHGDIGNLMLDNPQLASHLDDLHMAFKAVLKEQTKRRTEKRRERKEDCRICGKTFQKNYLKEYHMKTHTREKPTTCDVCGNKFSTWLGLRNHKAKVHRDQDIGRYQCHICSKMFMRKGRFDEHLQRHAGIVTQQCKVCLKGYTGSYKEHVEKVHQKEGFTVDNLPSCDWCGQRFRDGHALKMHLLKHTKETVKCEICDKKLRPNAINLHMARVHGGKRRKEMTECSICKKPVSKTYLSLHMAFHSDKRFQCEDCGKFFPLKHNLDTHRLSHTEHRPYSCDLCEKTFKLPHHMRAHRKTHKD